MFYQTFQSHPAFIFLYNTQILARKSEIGVLDFKKEKLSAMANPSVEV